MLRYKRFDVFISFAEEDKSIGRKVYEALKAQNVHCYFYPEHGAEDWGNGLFDTIFKRMTASRIVLVISSENTTDGFWRFVEQHMSKWLFKNQASVLELYLNGSQIDRRYTNVIVQHWTNNPDEIAGMIRKKTERIRKREAFYRSCALLLLTALLFYSWLHFTAIEQRDRAAQIATIQPQKVLIKAGGANVFSGGPVLHSFYLSPTEVTVGQYKAFCDSTGRTLPPQPSHTHLEVCPVVNVSWEEASAYCAWQGGRLPTESEWFYAAGAGGVCKYSGGNNASKVAVYGGRKPSMVATKCANGFGLYDMTGNVAEWCADWFGNSPAADSSTALGPVRERAVRGGGYNSTVSGTNSLLISFRSKAPPDSRQPYLGFRIAWDL